MESSKAFCAKPWRIILLLAGACLLSGVFFSLAGFSAQPDEASHSNSNAEHRTEKHTESPLSIVWRWGNFLILFGGLGYYLRKPLTEFLESRSKSIEVGLLNAQEAKESSLKQLGEIEARMNRLDQEVQELKNHAFKEAQEEKSRILESARSEAQKILDMAQREIEGMKKSARLELKSHVAALAVKLAEERLKKSVGPEENRRIILEFLESLEVAKN